MTTGRAPDSDGQFVMPADVIVKARKLTRDGVLITISPAALINRIVNADDALNSSSNDSEHDALYYLREWLSEIYEDPRFRTKGNHLSL